MEVNTQTDLQGSIPALQYQQDVRMLAHSYARPHNIGSKASELGFSENDNDMQA